MAALLNVEPVRTIRLYGVLGATFGREYRLSVTSPKEAIRALSVIVPGFERFLNTSKQRGLTYAVFSGKRNLLNDEALYGQEHRGNPYRAGDHRQ